MANTTPDQVQAWLEDVSGQNPKRFDLRRRVDGVRVQMWQWREGENLAELGTRILKSAERDGIGQPQARVSYNLRADSENGDEDGIGTLTVTVTGAHAKGKPDGAEELELGGSPKDINLHILKQNAELHRLLVASQEGRTLALERQVEALERRNADGEKRHMTLITLTDSLAMAKLEREIHAKAVEIAERRQDYAINKLDRYLPIAMNRLLGGGHGKGAPMSDELVEQLLGKMDPKRIEALMGGEPIALSEDERILLAELYTSAAAKHAARESRGARPLNSDANGKAANTEEEKPS